MNRRQIGVFLLAVINLASGRLVRPINQPVCEVGNDYFTAGPECYNFYSCRNGVLEIIECPPGLLWDEVIVRCEPAEFVDCEDEEITTTTAQPTAAPTTEAPTSPPSNTFLPETEGALPILFPGSECPDGIRAFILHPTDCRRYFYCLYGIRYAQMCPFLEMFNFVVGHCVPPEDSFCFPGSA